MKNELLNVDYKNNPTNVLFVNNLINYLTYCILSKFSNTNYDMT